MNTSKFSAASVKNKENTSRILTNEFLNPEYATPYAFTPKMSNTVIKFAVLTGALTINAGVGTSTTPPNIGDTLDILLEADATGRTVTLGTGLVGSATTLVLGVSKKGYLGFMFDGVAWVETGRTIGA